MALGGYKFDGRFCQKGSLTDLEWVSLMHKTKVTAFMAANTASNAGWAFDMADSPDGNYHCLDSEGWNYVTVFKRVNANDTTWFALYTLCKHTKTGEDAGAVKRNLISAQFATSTYWFLGAFACSFFRVGTSKIGYDDDLLNIDSLVDSTPLIPTGNTGTVEPMYYQDSYIYGSIVSFFNNSTFYFGIATKNDNVIIFSGKNQTSSELCCAIASGHGFNNFLIPGDSHGSIGVNLQRCGIDSPYDEIRSRNTSGTQCQVAIAFNDSGQWNTPVGLFASGAAVYRSTLGGVPYQAITVGGIKDNSSGVMGKGTLSIGLMSWSATDSTSTYPTVYSPYANGNYLCVTPYNSSSSYMGNSANNAYGFSYGYWFVGWDSSNPDIRQSSSWAEVTL